MHLAGTVLIRIAIVSISTLFGVACSKSSTTPATSTATDLGTTFPLGLAISSPTSQSAASLAVNAAGIGKFEVDSDLPAEEKAEELETLLSGSTCSITVTLGSATNTACYGPSVTYANHPNGYPNAPSGDLGIWDHSSSDGEACAASQLNSRMSGVTTFVDAGMFAMAGLICKAQTLGLALPDAGESLDLTSSMAGLVTINATALSVTTATLARSATDSGSNPVYVTTLEGTAGTKTYSIRLKHIPTDADNVTYSGKLSVSIATDSGTKSGNCNSITGSTTGSTDATSILYSKSSATAAVYELRNASFCGDDADPFVSATNRSVDVTAKAVSTSNPDGWGDNGNYLLASYNPEDDTGTYLYAWQAGANDGKTRVFNASITSTGGKAFFGFGPDLTLNTNLGSIAGMHCNWLNGLSSSPSVTKAQKQTMTLTSGTFTTTASDSKITFDPVDSCESSSGTFTVTPTGGTARSGSSTTLDLVDVSTIATDISSITAPTDID